MIFIFGCITTNNELTPLAENTDNEDQVLSSVIIEPEDKLILVTGEEIIYKGNVNIRSSGEAEWKATFFISDDIKQRFDLGSGESKTIGITKILVKQIITYQTGSVEIEVIEG
tara:strand:+ start:1866 stop:2204 length:339 start_codon:yes stop_codon:yes gene_type:complete